MASANVGADIAPSEAAARMQINSRKVSVSKERKRVPVMGDHLVPNSKRVAIVGGGLVGAMEALYMAKRGFDVDLYEMRSDIRLEEMVEGRSINLALSTRGREALKAVGLEDEVVTTGIPMFGRRIHSLTGEQSFIPYGKKEQCILSVDRRKLNETLLTAAEKCPNVDMHFDHKLSRCNIKTGEMTYINYDNTRETTADLVVGCDGAFSAVRRSAMRSTRLNYQQEYIPHGYKELTMPPKEDGTHAMAKNCLHIWPRNEFMMIALPNQDGSFTCTMFCPFDFFDSVKDETTLIERFEQFFPDSIPLFGRDRLVEMYFTNPVGSLVSVKCNPHNVGGRCVLLGDAAHAMVPFYGQGMNCGFEDCLLLDELLLKNKLDFAATLDEYNSKRQPDAYAICDLAMYNYIEMRSLVNSKSFLLRKKVDSLLNYLFPRSFIPLYSMVTFSRIPYGEVIERRKRQDKLVKIGGGVFALTAGALLCYGVYKRRELLHLALRYFGNLITLTSTPQKTIAGYLKLS
ncbi:kynurenine 3-monooxygenase-like [Sycon ciliatum]|uniref:kynurenine 3-monooxygenase-like n=1 Tax=Sycon ciliatum TaxID=27933 RepID=UPI0031F71023